VPQPLPACARKLSWPRDYEFRVVLDTDFLTLAMKEDGFDGMQP
jgi:hypothetical protein